MLCYLLCESESISSFAWIWIYMIRKLRKYTQGWSVAQWVVLVCLAWGLVVPTNPIKKQRGRYPQEINNRGYMFGNGVEIGCREKRKTHVWYFNNYITHSKINLNYIENVELSSSITTFQGDALLDW